MYKYKMIMKKILLGLVLLLTTATMNAQIELEHVFNGWIYPEASYSNVNRAYGMENYYVVINMDLECTEIYDRDFNYLFTADAFPYIIAKNIFTTNNEICYLTTRDGDILKLCNQEGVLLKEFEFESDNPPFLKKVGDEYKLIILAWNTAMSDYETHVYSLPGNGEVTTSVEDVPAKVKRNAYPNPASDLVTLPYEVDGATSMKIYDMQGKLVERKFLDESKQELQLDIKDYTSGMYFFEVNGESNSFIVK